MEAKPMLRKINKTLGMAIAGMCLVSTLAIAQVPAPSVPMVCTKIDAMGNCIEAKGMDDKMVIVRGEGVKVGEKMTCVTSGTSTTCKKETTMVK